MPNMSAAENVEVARRSFAGWNEGGVQGSRDVGWTDDAEFHDILVANGDPSSWPTVVRHLPSPRAEEPFDASTKRMIVTREDGEAVWAERRLDQAAWAVVRPVRSAFQFHGSRRSS